MPQFNLGGKTLKKKADSLDEPETTSKSIKSVCLSDCFDWPIVHNAFAKLNCKSYEYSEPWELFFSACQWEENKPTVNVFKNLQPFQTVNYFPEAWNTFRKDISAIDLNSAYKKFGEEFNIYPQSWTLPEDYDNFCAHVASHPDNFYIIKPKDEQRGEGISVTGDPMTAVNKNDEVLVQVYINNPLLMEGYKFDMRIMVLIDSLSPFKIYIYKEGYVRLSSKKYTKATKNNVKTIFNAENRLMHLTNYSLNKVNEFCNFKEATGFAPEENKNSILRSLEYFNYWLENVEKVNSEKIMNDIDELCVKTLLASHPRLIKDYNDNGRPNAFQVLGFDVMLDEQYKPWFIEINHNPDLLEHPTLCTLVNTQLVEDLLNLRDRPGVEECGMWKKIFDEEVKEDVEKYGKHNL